MRRRPMASSPAHAAHAIDWASSAWRQANLATGEDVPHPASIMRVNPIQLFDTDSSTFTYLLIDPASSAAVIIDPVDRHIERDLAHLRRIDLQLAYVLETHTHADHITSNGALCQRTGALSAVPSGCGIAPATVQLHHGDVLHFGIDETVQVLHTPGHTTGSMCYLWRGNVFTGDTLLIDGCGRTDFQGGSAAALYDSVTEQLFTLPGATMVWPAHDYNGQSTSTIGWERAHNARLATRCKADFIVLMGQLDLPRPRLFDIAVPANRKLGL
jgi:sulfur dioxygenase